MSLNESYPQHVVTAVIVAHDGAAWLPQVADALLGQTRPAQRVVAVDTGSRDRSGAVLASKFGQSVVFGMDRATGYGVAVSRALAHRAASVPMPASSGLSSTDRVEWLWFLHDDCEPAPDALEQLLRGAAETSAAAVLGPKLRDWSNRDVVLEAGITLDTAGRRLTGIEPREVDQGQHDGDRDALAVSSAGMLVRRDVWEQVGGFDPAMGLFMEDIDFCWRAHSAGYRVRVITDAICYHVQAATKRRRPVSVGRRARMLDRRNGLIALLGNLPAPQMLTTAAGNVVVSFLRISFFLVAKRMAAALDESAAVAAVLGHPVRFAALRRRRARGRRAAYSRVKADLPPGRSARRLAEFVASTMLKSAQAETTGAHHASADPTDDDSLLVDNGLGRRLLTSPSLLLFGALLAVALVAGRSLIGGGPLGGGSLVPLWGGASDLWHTYLQAFHPDGIGSAAAAPPYLAVLAALATVLGGKPWLAADVILLGCVPLSGMTAMLAVRRITSSAPVRVWAAASYALLPVATGVVAGARFGTAAAFILLPLIVACAGRVCTESGQSASRAAWATGLLVAIGAAFVPLLWLLAFVACCVAGVVLRPTSLAPLRNLAIVALTAPILLLPWSLRLISNPAQLLLEAGLPQQGTPAAGLPARALVLLSPGGPGLPPYWVTAGLIVAAAASLFASRRRGLIIAGWGLALAGLVAAVAVSHLTVAPSDGAPVTGWAGLPLAIAATGLLLAAATGADSLSQALSGRKGWQIQRGPGAWAALIGLVACSAPLLAAAWWLSTGIRGPVHPVASPLVPQVVAVAGSQGSQVRTLVLRSAGGRVSYLLLRGPSPTLADTALTPPADARQALARAVADLISPAGDLGRSQAQVLADFDIGYVLLETPVDQRLARVLNDVNGLQPYNNTSGGVYLWQLTRQPARVTVVEPNGTVVPIKSGPVGVSGALVPSAGGTLMLAEPASGWHATVNGRALPQVPSPAGPWAQAFRLPAGGGTLELGYSGFGHDVVLVLELLALLALVGLALPGIRVAEQDAQHAAIATSGQRSARAGRAAGRGAAGDRPAAGDREDADADADGDDRDESAGSRRRAAPARRRVGRTGRSSRSSGRKRGAGRLPAAGRGGSDGVKLSEDRPGAGSASRTGGARAGADDDSRAAASRANRDGADASGTGRAGRGMGLASRGGAAAGAVGAGLGAIGSRALPGRRPSAPPAGRGADDRRTGRPGGARPYADADGRDDSRRAELSGSPQARAWPYVDSDYEGTGAASHPPRTESAGWPYPEGDGSLGDDRRADAPGRSPSSRSPSSRSPSSRSPSGDVPPTSWSEPTIRRGDPPRYDISRYAAPQYDVPQYYTPQRAQADRDRIYDPPSYTPTGSDRPSYRDPADSEREHLTRYDAARYDSARESRPTRRAAGRDRGRGDRDGYRDEHDQDDVRRSAAGGRADLSDGQWDEPAPERPSRRQSGERPGSELERRVPSDDSAPRRSGAERGGWRLGAGRAGRFSGREPASRRGVDPANQRARQDRSGRPGGGRPGDFEADDLARDSLDAGRRVEFRSGESRSGEFRSGEFQSGERGQQRPGRSDRWGRREPDGRYDEPGWSVPAADPVAGDYRDWRDTGESDLDPLPPRPGSQARSTRGRRNVWRPDAGPAQARHDRQWSDESTGDWDDLGHVPAPDRRPAGRPPQPARGPGRPWAEPESDYEPEPEYEGDSW